MCACVLREREKKRRGGGGGGDYCLLSARQGARYLQVLPDLIFITVFPSKWHSLYLKIKFYEKLRFGGREELTWQGLSAVKR